MQEKISNFDQILGQSHAVESITRAYENDRLPHGLIFAGPIGVGKATTARVLGQLFLCEHPKNVSPCGKCTSCKSFAADSHPDFHVIYRQLARLESQDVKAKSLSADVIRDFLVSKAAMKSVVGVGKVFVIEEADLMNLTAQNTLLKTLEEPAGRTLIILLTDQPDALLPTIRSRCQLVRFASLDEKLVREQLQKHGIKKEQAEQAARFAQGSLGLSLRWIEDGVIERAGQLEKLLEKVEPTKLQAWMKAAAEEYAEKQLGRDKLASKDQATREGLILYLKLAAEVFQRRLRENDDAELESICEGIDSVVRAEGYLESNVNIPLVLQQFAGALEKVG